jgi:hypothetical protein
MAIDRTPRVRHCSYNKATKCTIEGCGERVDTSRLWLIFYGDGALCESHAAIEAMAAE